MLSAESALPLNEEQTDEPVDASLLRSGAMVLKLESSVCYLPHPDKVSYGGEDAHFISNTGGGALGVADGVGGWQESGVNPAEYSRTFMRIACSYLEGSDGEQPDADWHLVDPKGAMDVAHQRTKVAGSATACVMQLDQRNQTFVAANLGDSGFVLIRQKRIIARSKPLQHYFDCPLQFGAFPEYVEATDTAEQADVYQIAVQPGDMIVAGSDGLWDNVFDHEVISTVTSTTVVQEAANALAALARQHASDTEFSSPYIQEALLQGFDLPWWDKIFGATWKNGRFQLRQLSGGKQDDITVIVAQVVAEPLKLTPLPAEAAEQPE